jgi:hypothetical protein
MELVNDVLFRESQAFRGIYYLHLQGWKARQHIHTVWCILLEVPSMTYCSTMNKKTTDSVETTGSVWTTRLYNQERRTFHCHCRLEDRTSNTIEQTKFPVGPLGDRGGQDHNNIFIHFHISFFLSSSILLTSFGTDKYFSFEKLLWFNHFHKSSFYVYCIKGKKVKISP